MPTYWEHLQEINDPRNVRGVASEPVSDITSGASQPTAVSPVNADEAGLAEAQKNQKGSRDPALLMTLAVGAALAVGAGYFLGGK